MRWNSKRQTVDHWLTYKRLLPFGDSEQPKCLECGEDLIVKNGKINIPHFAHYADGSCNYGVGMSEWHWDQQEEHQKHGWQIEHSITIGGEKYRFDAFHSASNTVREFVHSYSDTYTTRNAVFVEAGFRVEWIVDGDEMSVDARRNYDLFDSLRAIVLYKDGTAKFVGKALADAERWNISLPVNLAEYPKSPHYFQELIHEANRKHASEKLHRVQQEIENRRAVLDKQGERFITESDYKSLQQELVRAVEERAELEAAFLNGNATENLQYTLKCKYDELTKRLAAVQAEVTTKKGEYAKVLAIEGQCKSIKNSSAVLEFAISTAEGVLDDVTRNIKSLKKSLADAVNHPDKVLDRLTQFVKAVESLQKGIADITLPFSGELKNCESVVGKYSERFGELRDIDILFAAKELKRIVEYHTHQLTKASFVQECEVLLGELDPTKINDFDDRLGNRIKVHNDGGELIPHIALYQHLYSQPDSSLAKRIRDTYNKFGQPI